jgi:hypothetical protein
MIPGNPGMPGTHGAPPIVAKIRNGDETAGMLQAVKQTHICSACREGLQWNLR